ncbi:MAG: N-acetylneuraminate synthase family protein [Burkholderiales bacterium]
MQIKDAFIGSGNRPFIIAEVAQSHEGSLGLAFSFIDVAKECGADAIKFQTHIASEESTPAEPWRVRFSRQDASRYDYWKRMEFTLDQWHELKVYADSRDIVFLSSPFSVQACQWLEEIGMPAWKIASGEAHNPQLLQWVLATGKPVILSSGLSAPAETIALAHTIRNQGVAVAVLHSTPMYPTAAEDVGLNLIDMFSHALPDIPVGLSDHSGVPFPGIVASYMGASIIEVHFTLHRKMFGPDVSASLTPDGLAALVEGSRFAWRMRHHSVDKIQQLSGFSTERTIFSRSLYTTREIAAGEQITAADVAYKKPGGGLTYDHLEHIVGHRARQALPNHHPLRLDDVQ